MSVTDYIPGGISPDEYLPTTGGRPGGAVPRRVWAWLARRVWLRYLLGAELVLLGAALALNAVGETAAGSGTDSLVLVAAMLAAWGLLLGVVGACALFVSVALTAARAVRSGGRR